MFSTAISPRVYETDAFGHINNTSVPGWFEKGREPLFRIFTPDLDIRKMPLILARMEVDFLAIPPCMSCRRLGKMASAVRGVSVW